MPAFQVVAVCAPAELIGVAGWKVEVWRDRASALSYIQQQLGAEV